MKAQILTIISILTLTSLSFAKECSPENLAGVWSASSKFELPGQSCGNSTVTSVFRYYLFNVDGVLNGHGYAQTQTIFKKCPGIDAQVQFPKVRLMNSQLAITDDLGDVSTSKCDVSADGNTLTIGEAQYIRAPGSQAQASHNSAKQNEKTKAIEEMGSWAPVAPTPEAPKQSAAPVSQVNSNGGSKISTVATAGKTASENKNEEAFKKVEYAAKNKLPCIYEDVYMEKMMRMKYNAPACKAHQATTTAKQDNSGLGDWAPSAR